MMMTMKVLFMGQTFQFWGFDSQNLRERRWNPKSLGTSLRGMTRSEPSLVQIGRAV